MQKQSFCAPPKWEVEVWVTAPWPLPDISLPQSVRSRSRGKRLCFSPNAGGLDFSFHSLSLVAFAVNCDRGLHASQEHVWK